MLEIVEIIKPADQGRTTPFLCNASDHQAYFVKGYAATVAGLMKEWLGANLAKAFGLPVPRFEIAYLDHRLVAEYGGKAISELREGFVFASKQIPSVTEIKIETAKTIDANLKQAVLIFDLWVENEDRSLSETGGNPNLLWKPDDSSLYVIDHNLIFEDDFNKENFWQTHIFRSEFCNKQQDLVEKLEFESRMKAALDSWQIAWDNIPEEWLEFNDEYLFFNPDKHLQRLRDEANGNIWLKLP